MRATVLLAAAGAALIAQAAQPLPPTAAQQRPVFRGGTHFVRVDAYPTVDGKIVEGLQAGDFEILEDGKPQQIESFDFVRFDTFTPVAVRRNPSSQREGFDMAADPRYRLFVLVVNVGSEGMLYIQQPLIDFLDRVLGPSDLFGLLTTQNSAKDLVLGQKSEVAREVIADLWRSGLMDRDEADDLLDPCGEVGRGLKGRFRLDRTYTGLESLVAQLGSLRQERKNIILVSNNLSHPPANSEILERRGPIVPKAGITRGRVGIGDHDALRGNDAMCASEVQRLAMMDFDVRFRALLQAAREDNVSFYAITPAGLQAPFTPAGIQAVNRANDNLLTLANETDGLAIVNTNDLTGGMKKIADDLAAYYVLGYYTANTKFDGGIRKIKVRLKANGAAVRARRQYRAPTQAEIAALAAGVGTTSSPAPAPAGAAPPRPASWTLMGDPVAFRSTSRTAPQPVAAFEFARNERLRVEWPVLAALDRRDVRLLDKAGKPLPVELPLTEDAARAMVVLEISLSGFSPGDYQIELTAGAGGVTEKHLLAIRIK